MVHPFSRLMAMMLILASILPFPGTGPASGRGLPRFGSQAVTPPLLSFYDQMQNASERIRMSQGGGQLICPRDALAAASIVYWWGRARQWDHAVAIRRGRIGTYGEIFFGVVLMTASYADPSFASLPILYMALHFMLMAIVRNQDEKNPPTDGRPLVTVGGVAIQMAVVFAYRLPILFVTMSNPFQLALLLGIPFNHMVLGEWFFWKVRAGRVPHSTHASPTVSRRRFLNLAWMSVLGLGAIEHKYLQFYFLYINPSLTEDQRLSLVDWMGRIDLLQTTPPEGMAFALQFFREQLEVDHRSMPWAVQLHIREWIRLYDREPHNHEALLASLAELRKVIWMIVGKYMKPYPQKADWIAA